VGSLAVAVKAIKVRAPLYEVEEDGGSTKISSSDALVTADVVNEDRQQRAVLGPTQVALLWEGGGCRPERWVIRDDGDETAAAVAVNPGETRRVRFTCHRFPFVRNRTSAGFIGDSEDDADGPLEFSMGRPAIDLGLFVAPGPGPTRAPLLASEEHSYVREMVDDGVFRPRWSSGLGLSLGAAPAPGEGPYRSYIEAESVSTVRLVELTLAFAAQQTSAIALNNEGATTLVLSPGVGLRLPLGETNLRLRGGWSWAPRFERSGQAQGPHARIGWFLQPWFSRLRGKAGRPDEWALAHGGGLGLWVGWSHLRPIDEGKARPAHRIVAGLAIETIWGSGR
jgi:hypothetical protein